MNRTVHKICAWSRTACLVVMVVSFVVIAGLIPAKPPSLTAVETTQYIIDNRTRI